MKYSLLVFDSNAAIRWEFTPSNVDPNAIRAVFYKAEGVIYLDTGPQLIAVGSDGQVLWEREFEGMPLGVTSDGGLICSYGGDLVALDKSGTEKWRASVSDDWIRGVAISSNDTIYVDDGRIVSADGALLPSIEDARGWPAIDTQGNIYITVRPPGQFSGDPAFLSAFSPDGEKLWTYETRGPLSLYPIVDPDTVYVLAEVGHETYIYAIRK